MIKRNRWKEYREILNFLPFTLISESLSFRILDLSVGLLPALSFARFFKAWQLQFGELA